MTAADLRCTLRQAADLTGTSVDTLRRRVEDGKLPGAGKDPGDPRGSAPGSGALNGFAWMLVSFGGTPCGKARCHREPRAALQRRTVGRDRR